MFFFGGHGTEEKTDIPAFRKTSATQNLASFFCYGSEISRSGVQSDPEKTCLADKELRYLINKLSQNGSDLYVISDCCHSGGISRKHLRSRKISRDPINGRTWEGFIFHDDPAITQEDLASKPLVDVIPEGNHIQLSACRNVELAWEHAGEDGKPGGLFTISLIKTLNAAGPNVSIFKLNNQISNFLRGWPEVDNLQTPQIHVVSDNPEKRFQGFLGVELEADPFKSQIVYNPHLGWILGLGQIHGIEGSDESNMPSCQIFIGPDKNQEQTLTLSEVLPTYSKLIPEDSWNLNTDVAYPCEIEVNITPISLYIEAKEEVKKTITQQLLAFKSKKDEEHKKAEYIKIEDDEDWADYVLRIEEEEYNITLPNDPRPLILNGIVKNNKIQIEHLFTLLGQIAKWKFLKNARNNNTHLGENLDPALNGKPIQIDFFYRAKNGEIEPLPINNGAANIELTRKNRFGYPAGGFGISLSNKSDRELFCGLMYLSMQFGVSVNLFDPSGVYLAPGESISMKGGKLSKVGLPKYIYRDNWVGSTGYVKLIASTAPFDLIPLGMKSLEPPYSDNRSPISWGEDDSLSQEDDWIAYDVELLIVNPFYKMKGEETEETEIQR